MTILLEIVEGSDAFIKLVKMDSCSLLLSLAVRKMMRSPLAPVVVFLPLRGLFSTKPRDKNRFRNLLTVAWFIPRISAFFYLIDSIN